VNVFDLRMLESWLNITINERFGCGRHALWKKEAEDNVTRGRDVTLGKWFREVGYQ